MSLSTLTAARESAAFDTLAPTYDELFTESLIGKVQRASVWREVDRHFGLGQRILEINCGTGVDALHLAQRGVRAVACDISPEMIAVAQRRIAREGLGSFVDFRVLATERIRRLGAAALFDGALSDFAGLNCVEDLSAVGSELARLLKPGAKFVVCVFGRWCLWEVLWYLARGKAHKAFRRLRREATVVHLTDGAGLRVCYPSVRNLKRAFAPYFRLERWKGVGVAVPPSYLECFAARHRRALQAAAFLDHGFSRIPVVRSLADHILLTFERTG